MHSNIPDIVLQIVSRISTLESELSCYNISITPRTSYYLGKGLPSLSSPQRSKPKKERLKKKKRHKEITHPFLYISASSGSPIISVLCSPGVATNDPIATACTILLQSVIPLSVLHSFSADARFPPSFYCDSHRPPHQPASPSFSWSLVVVQLSPFLCNVRNAVVSSVCR